VLVPVPNRQRSAACRGALLGLALLAAPAAAGAHQERLPAAPLLRDHGTAPRAALEAIERWDLPGARAAIDGLPPAAAGHAAVLRAQLAFYAGDYEEAARRLGELPAPVRGDPEFGAFATLVGATRDMRRGLRAVESEHFVLWHDPARDWVLPEPALEALERGYRALGAWLGDFPREKVRVEVIASAEDFERVSSLTKQEIETSGAIGICKFNKIMVLSPRLLARGYRWRDTLAHEYLHYLEVRLSANRAPIWLQEGVARYGETRWRTEEPFAPEDVDRSLLARALREDTLVGFDAMDPSLVRLPSMGAVRLAFAECALAVDYILRGWQVEGLRRVFAELARAEEYRGMDPVLQAALGVGLERFQAGWRADLAGRGFQEVPGAVVPELRLSGEGSAEEWDLAEWQPLAAQNHLRLGDLLRARGSAAAALREYERARKISPASPFVLVKIARLQLQLGAPEPAAAAAREAVRAFADYPAAHEALAAALAAAGDAEGVRAALAESLEINPFNPFAWRERGLAERRLGREAEARRSLGIAARLNPDDQETRHYLGEQGR
jgi:tetratricopeptide (TPR) repeat protein